MGEVDAAPAAPAPPMPDLTALEVDPAKGERFHKAAFVHSKEGTTHRLVAKTLPNLWNDSMKNLRQSKKISPARARKSKAYGHMI